MSFPSAAESLGNDLRRSVILANLLDMCFDWLNRNEHTPSYIAGASVDVRRAIKKYMNVLRNASPKLWAQVEQELQEERVSDLLELFETMLTVTNVQDVIDSINAAKTPITHAEEASPVEA